MENETDSENSGIPTDFILETEEIKEGDRLTGNFKRSIKILRENLGPDYAKNHDAVLDLVLRKLGIPKQAGDVLKIEELGRAPRAKTEDNEQPAIVSTQGVTQVNPSEPVKKTIPQQTRKKTSVRGK